MVGDLVGDLVGDVVGDLVGDVVGDLVGDVVGDEVGAGVVGDEVGAVVFCGGIGMIPEFTLGAGDEDGTVVAFKQGSIQIGFSSVEIEPVHGLVQNWSVSRSLSLIILSSCLLDDSPLSRVIGTISQ